MAKGVWGLDVSKSSLKAARLQFIKGRVELTDVDVIEYSPAPSRDEAGLEQEIRIALSTLVSRHKLKGDVIAASLPSHSAFNRFVKLPPVASERLNEIVQYEAQQHIPFPINEVIWRYQSIERIYQPGEELDVVLFAIKKELVDQFLALLSLSRISVDIIQFAPMSLYNFIMLDADIGKNLVILDIGANNTDLILVDKEKFWIRNLPIVGNDITRAIQQKLDLPFPEAEKLKVNTTSQETGKVFNAIQPVLKDLVSEIHRSIGYYKSLSSPGKSVEFEKIVMLGNASKTIYFGEFLSQRLQLEATRLSRLNKIDIGLNLANKNMLQDNLPALGVAFGLGLQGLGLTANRINLLPQELVRLKSVSRKKPYIAAFAAIVALALTVFHFSAASHVDQLEKTRDEVEILLQDSKDIRQRYEKVKKVDDKINQLEEMSRVIPERDIRLKILNAFNKIPVLVKNNLDGKEYIEVDNEIDLERLKEFEKDKIWILSLKMTRDFRKDTEGKPDLTQPIIDLSIVCGMVYQEGKDGQPDSEASQSFVMERLVKSLAEEFNISGKPPELQGSNKPVPELRTLKEEKEIPGDFVPAEPKYYRFLVKLQIPISKSPVSPVPPKEGGN